MHELSIAQGIVDIIHQYVSEEDAAGVRSVRLKVGDQAGVVVDSLEFCFAAVTAKTPLQRAHLEIERVPFRLQCGACRRTLVNSSGTVLCPECGSAETRILSGTELQVLEIELIDGQAEGS